jgi:CDP-diacylglycerol--serine O-phosphatidyltransferase
MRKIYLLPNLFTSCSLLAGMLAIFEVIDGDPHQACWLIVLATILDVADGAIARLTKSTSAFGLHLDSLADLVAFGVAPALLAFHAFADVSARMATTVCSLYVVCGALRLARFNVQAPREERKSFLGLPIPAAALGVTGLVWVLFVDAHLSNPVLLSRLGPPVMVILAYLMVSKVVYFSFKQIDLADRQPFELLVSFIVVVLLLYMLKQHLDIVLAVGSWIYILTGLTVSLVRRRRWLTRHDEAQTLATADNRRQSFSSRNE